MTEKTQKRRLNVVVLGENGVGKTALLLRFTSKMFNPNKRKMMLEPEGAQININNKKLDLLLWDTAGREPKAIIKCYFRKADGVLLVYDVTNLDSFIELPRWLSGLRRENETAPVLIVGNKIDVANSQKRVTIEQVKEFAERNKLDFMESSAKSGENVDKIFQTLTRKMLVALNENLEEDVDESKLTLAEGQTTEVKKKSGCFEHFSSMTEKTQKRRLNVVVLGETGVGKTALLLRFTRKMFNPYIQHTVVVDVLQAQININNKKLDLLLWDTAGQEVFKAIVKCYFRKADGVLLVYDVTNLDSFIELPRWLSDLRRENETAPVLIVGNKIDVANSQERVTIEQVKEFAERNKLDFMESSAKSGENVDKIFQTLTRKMLVALNENLEEDVDESKLTLAEGQTTEVKKKSGCC